MKTIGLTGMMYLGLMQSGMPKTKAQRITGHYDPETDKPQGRNDPCKCGSGLKFKKCHGVRDPKEWRG